MGRPERILNAGRNRQCRKWGERLYNWILFRGGRYRDERDWRWMIRHWRICDQHTRRKGGREGALANSDQIYNDSRSNLGQPGKQRLYGGLSLCYCVTAVLPCYRFPIIPKKERKEKTSYGSCSRSPSLRKFRVFCPDTCARFLVRDRWDWS